MIVAIAISIVSQYRFQNVGTFPLVPPPPVVPPPQPTPGAFSSAFSNAFDRYETV